VRLSSVEIIEGYFNCYWRATSTKG